MMSRLFGDVYICFLSPKPHDAAVVLPGFYIIVIGLFYLNEFSVPFKSLISIRLDELLP